MKYCNGETVELFDQVEYQLGGTWVPATVVFIDGEKRAGESCSWAVESPPDWLEGCVGIEWADPELVLPVFFADGQSREGVDISVFFVASIEEDDELRFVSRGSPPPGEQSDH